MGAVNKILHTFIPRAFKGCHVMYFGAAASGAHGLYSLFAGAIVLVIVVAYVFSIELE